METLDARKASRLHRVFVGSQGLRSGWGLALFVAILSLIGVALHFLTKALHIPMKPPPGDLKIGFLLIGESCQCAIVLLVTWLMAKIEGRRFLAYGLGGGKPWPKFVAGIWGGVGCLSILVALLHMAGLLVFDGLAIHGAAIPIYAVLTFVGFIFVGVSEETLFRGYVQTTLTRGIGFWPGAILLSLLFGAAHLGNHGESALGIFGVVLAGLLFSALLWVSGSLWLGIGFHAGWDWAQSYLYGTPDSGLMFQGRLMVSHAVGNPTYSGGATGPEASLLMQPVLLFGLLFLIWVCKRSGLFK